MGADTQLQLYTVERMGIRCEMKLPFCENYQYLIEPFSGICKGLKRLHAFERRYFNLVTDCIRSIQQPPILFSSITFVIFIFFRKTPIKLTFRIFPLSAVRRGNKKMADFHRNWATLKVEFFLPSNVAKNSFFGRKLRGEVALTFDFFGFRKKFSHLPTTFCCENSKKNFQGVTQKDQAMKGTFVAKNQIYAVEFYRTLSPNYLLMLN